MFDRGRVRGPAAAESGRERRERSGGDEKARRDGVHLRERTASNTIEARRNASVCIEPPIPVSRVRVPSLRRPTTWLESLSALLVAAAVAACSPDVARSDGALTSDASDATASMCGTCGREVPCPSGLSLSCAGGLSCRNDAVFRRTAGLYHACDQSELERVRREDVCAATSTRLGGCRSGCGARPMPSRYAQCDLSQSDPTRTAAYARLLCADALPTVFTPCQDNADCHPAADVADLNLSCRGGRCQPLERPQPEPGFGASCGLVAPPAADGVLDAPRCARCVVRTRGCFAQRCSQRCQLDEDCPAGWDCSVDSRCEGVCLPRGSARDRSVIALACGEGDGGVADAGASDAGLRDP